MNTVERQENEYSCTTRTGFRPVKTAVRQKQVSEL